MALTSLASVKAWLSVTSTNDDTLLTNLINQLSSAIINYLARPSLVKTTYTELRSGVGNQRMVLRNWPVLSVSSLIIGTQTIPSAATFGQCGYTLATWDGSTSGNPQEITLNGYEFCRGNNNVQIIYKAGYCIQNETATIGTTPYHVTPLQPNGTWAQDDGVTFASTGIALTPIASGTPITGQYVPPNPFASSPVAYYLFAAADTAKGVLLNYSYIPADLEEACIEWVGERYKYKGRIGQSSQSLGGNETSAYSLKMPDHIKMLLANYEKFLPL